MFQRASRQDTHRTCSAPQPPFQELIWGSTSLMGWLSRYCRPSCTCGESAGNPLWPLIS